MYAKTHTPLNVHAGILAPIAKAIQSNIMPPESCEIPVIKNGELSLEEAIDLIKKNTRHFAKRQLTWLRHEDDTIFLNKSDYNHDDSKIIEYIIDEYDKL